MASYKIDKNGVVNPALLAQELKAVIGEAFSLAIDGAADAPHVSIITDAELSAQEQADADAVVAAHDGSAKTSGQETGEQRDSLQQLAGLLITGIDFDTLDAQIDTMIWQDATRGLYRAIYLLAVASGLTDQTSEAERAATELANYFGLLPPGGA